MDEQQSCDVSDPAGGQGLVPAASGSSVSLSPILCSLKKKRKKKLGFTDMARCFKSETAKKKKIAKTTFHEYKVWCKAEGTVLSGHLSRGHSPL